MTLAYDTGPTVIRIVFKDLHARVSVKDYVVPTTVWDPASDLLTAIATIRDSLVTELNKNTIALILNAFIVVRQTEDTLTLPAVDCHVNEIASIVCNLEDTPKKTTFQIPAPDDDVFAGASGPNYDIVDVEDTDLNTLLDMFQTTGGKFTLSDGETLADDTFPGVSGRRIFKKTGKK